ncbi:MAG: hypothetical protein U9N54_07045, partial [candidate division Zixibacteria bacterium]|nr:hypothetical protein [candidate division Zixibacteria bacterium]
MNLKYEQNRITEKKLRGEEMNPDLQSYRYIGAHLFKKDKMKRKININEEVTIELTELGKKFLKNAERQIQENVPKF